MVLLIIENGKWKQITKEEKDSMSEEEKKKTLYIDGLLKKKLDFGMKQQKNDNDVVGIVVGDEGSGKSTLSANCMRYISYDKFDPKKDMVGADYEDAIDKIDKAKEGSYLMFDEGNIFFLSTEVMKRESRDLHKVFSIFRQKRLFVLIVLPSFFRLHNYFAMDRSRFLMRTYLNKKGKRSYFTYWGNKNKEKLYRFGKKLKDYNCVRPNIRGRFYSCDLLDNKEYKGFKLSTLRESLLSAKDKIKKKISRKDIEINRNKEIIKLNMDMTTEKLGKMIGIAGSRVRQLKIQIKDEVNFNQINKNPVEMEC